MVINIDNIYWWKFSKNPNIFEIDHVKWREKMEDFYHKYIISK
jgi:hypothetical protein